MDYINNRDILGPEEGGYLDELAVRLKGVMDISLFEHSLGTMEFSLRIAGSCRRRVDIYRLSVASLVHDYGKIFTDSDLHKIAVEHVPGISGLELKLTPVLHSLVGGFLVSRDLGITDEKILRAVKIHTVGAVEMTMEEKILFISDKVEMTRSYKGVEPLRELALEDINLCLIEVYKNIIIYVINKNGLLHPDTSGIWNMICGGN